MTKRKAVSKKTRFEVFKRDAFTCQYCGKHAPDVVLHVDHIVAVVNGGKNALTNLVTSCADCNLGKGPRELDDNSAVVRQSNQLRLLQEKREQIEMIAEWHRSLISIEEQATTEAANYFSTLFPGRHLSESGLEKVRKYIAKHGLSEVMSAIRKGACYVKLTDGQCTEESATFGCQLFINTLKYKEVNERDPVGAQLRYIGGILRNRLPYVPYRCLKSLEAAHEAGVPIEQMKKMAIRATSWSAFESELYE